MIDLADISTLEDIAKASEAQLNRAELPMALRQAMLDLSIASSKCSLMFRLLKSGGLGEKKDTGGMHYAEAADEFHALDLYFIRCRDNGQGINSKETVRFQQLASRLVSLGYGERETSLYFNMSARECCARWKELTGG
jgi:hypothetical protein